MFTKKDKDTVAIILHPEVPITTALDSKFCILLAFRSEDTRNYFFAILKRAFPEYVRIIMTDPKGDD